MDRTKHSKILKMDNGSHYLSTIYYPRIPVKDTDEYIITNETTMLDTLAYTYYRDSSLWWIIYRANNMTRGVLAPRVGTQLRIPIEIDSVLSDFKKINNSA
jgi:hypothetical protein